MLILGPTMASETDKLIDGVLRGDSRALRELLLRLRPHCLQVLWDRFARLGDAETEILDDAESLLFEWSLGADARERLVRGESLKKLAFRLVWQVARDKERGEQRHQRLGNALAGAGDAAGVDPPAPGFGMGVVFTVVLALAETHREVLIAEARCQFGKGPPLEEALGLKPSAARMRLQRARAALVRALRDRGMGELLDEETVHV
jgi:DNA-directed RNA polymerase specialized sigma24 family protein